MVAMVALLIDLSEVSLTVSRGIAIHQLAGHAIRGCMQRFRR